MVFLLILVTGVCVVAIVVLWRKREFRYQRGKRVGGTIALIACSAGIWTVYAIFHEDFDRNDQHLRDRSQAVERGENFANVLTKEKDDAIRRAASDPLSGTWLQTTTEVALRFAPSSHSKRLGTLKRNTRVWMPGNGNTSGEWVHVDVDRSGHTGWVNSRFLTQPGVASEGGFFGWNQRPYFTVENANLRAEPDRDARVIAVIPAGSRVVMRAQNGLWLRVHSEKGDGWMHASTLRLAKEQEANAANLRAATFATRYVFPEETLLGKIGGVLVGLVISVIQAIVVPHRKRSERLLFVKIAVTWAYFLIKNIAVIRDLSGNEMMSLGVGAFILTGLVESIGETFIDALRSRGVIPEEA